MAGRSVLWRWDATATGGLAGAVAPQGTAAGSAATAQGDFDGDGLSQRPTIPHGHPTTPTAPTTPISLGYDIEVAHSLGFLR